MAQARRGAGQSGDDDGGDETDITAAVQAVLRKARGNPSAAVERLLEENYRAREARRIAKADLKALQEKFPEGSTVLNPDQAKAWAILTEKKIDTVDALNKELGKAPELQGKLDAAQKETLFADAADVLKFPKGTLKDLSTSRELEVTIVDEKIKDASGKEITQKVVQVKPKGADKPIAFEDFIKNDAPDYVALLGSGSGSTTTPTTNDPPKRRVAKQGSSSGGAADSEGDLSPVETILARNKQRAEAPNPLKPAAKT